jgi:hypothetical protein
VRLGAASKSGRRSKATRCEASRSFAHDHLVMPQRAMTEA